MTSLVDLSHMPAMLRFIANKTCLGIEITSSAIRLAALSGTGNKRSVLFTKSMELPAGLVSESYATPNVNDLERLATVLRESLFGASAFKFKRAALSLPDSVFRVQTLYFDELPGKAMERERLIRWRIEKGAFDIADSLLRYQVLKQRGKGFSVLACVAKRSVISQYEAALIGLGLEPWSVGLSSVHSFNFYSAYLSETSSVVAHIHVSEDYCTIIIAEAGEARFYRYRENKRAGTDGSKSRFVREIGDFLHFYRHHDRSRQTEIGQLYLTGDVELSSDVVEMLRDLGGIGVEALLPSAVIPSANGTGSAMAAALGAGSSL